MHLVNQFNMADYLNRFENHMHKLCWDAASRRLCRKMTKGQVTDDPIDEEEFDDLVYALRADTFVGGEDSQSLSGISRDLDPQSKNFAMQRISIADTHL